MDPTRWQKVERIVDTALTLSEQERTEYIGKECSGDPELHNSVTELLKSIEASEGYLEEPDFLRDDLLNAISEDLAEQENSSSMIGEQIGSYVITELLGYGGMGSVFLAERADNHFEHKVALKLIRRGMDTPDNIARFERERTILANLNHPNIGRMYDGGLTHEGLPYLIMEFVDGVPIDEYCRQKQLSTSKRIELFKAACKAVQHAHNNLVIHRDLKPANILVDPNGQVKILDFGIAKLLEEDQPGKTVFNTKAGGQMLTLGYAAPEQLTEATVTTATDIYALGVLLHQLLTDTHPFDFEDKTISEIKEIIKHQSPAKPSSHGRQWVRIDQEDMDAIILKTLRKEAELRYNSAGELLEDLNRYEQGLPVAAHDDTFRYNASKFIKRHRGRLSTAAVILLLVTGFGIFYTLQIAKQRNQARIQAEKAQQITDFMLQLFEANDPDQAQGDELPVRAILEKGSQSIEQIKDQPEIKATMYSVLGNIYRKLGEPQKALPLLTKSSDLANTTSEVPSTTKADILSNLGLIKDEIGEYTEAESLFVQADKMYTQSLGKPSRAQAINLTNLAELYVEMSQFEKAEETQLAGLDILDNLPLESADSKAHAFNQLAIIHKRQGKSQEAEKYFKQSLEIHRNLHTEPYPAIATNLHNLGVLYYEAGTYDSARVYLEAGLKQRKKLFGDQHPLVASTLNGLGILSNVTADYEEALHFLTEGMEILKNHYGKKHVRVALNMMNLAVVLKNMENYEQSISFLKQAGNIIQNQLGPEHFYYAIIEQNLAKTYRKAGLFNLSEESYKRALRLLEKVSPNHQRTGGVHVGLANLLMDRSAYSPAEEHLREALKIYTFALDSTSSWLGSTQILLGKSLYYQEKYEEAETSLVTGKSILENYSESGDELVSVADSLLEQLARIIHEIE